ncbi:MAG: hypothetical protein KGO96_07405 [Elusimicrobia bacterium]|nr:hypothetical protein [Elusimicrobiota bacterium]
MPISRYIPRLIDSALDSLFNDIKTAFLGPKYGGDKSLIISFNRYLSLPGIYEEGNKEEGGIPDLSTLDYLTDISESYLDSAKENAKARLLAKVNSIIEDSPNLNESDLNQKIEEELGNIFNSMSSKLEQIVSSESQNAKNMGLMNGIVGMNANAGIEDPVVFFVCPPLDNKFCDECRRLHLMPDLTTPRLWYLSELKHDYAKKGDSEPSRERAAPNVSRYISYYAPFLWL